MNSRFLFSAILLASFSISIHHCAQAQIITRFAGTGVAGYSGDGYAATLAQMDTIGEVTIISNDSSANLYIGDGSNYRERQINLLDTSFIINTFAGDGLAGYSGDGGPATNAELIHPGRVAIDKHNNIYINEYYGHRIRKISPSGIISTFAGTGVSGFSGDGGPAAAAKFDHPGCVFVDKHGNLLVADQYNHCIRKIDTSGFISTIAGTPTISAFGGDGGPATNAHLSYPTRAFADSLDNIYIVDNSNHCIRKVDSAGTITTIAGTGGVSGFSGDGGPASAAQLNYPSGIDWDSHGNMYIADAANNRVRMIDASTGSITTIAGNGFVGSTGDGGPATAASFNFPVDLALDKHNNIYVADWHNYEVRKISALYPPLASKEINSIEPRFNVYPNPSTGIIYLTWENMQPDTYDLAIVDILGREVLTEEIKITNTTKFSELSLSQLENGVYWLSLKNNKYSISKSIVVCNK